MKSPAFQFYPDDIMASYAVSLMTNEEFGIYVKLLCLNWVKGGFVYDPVALAKWCRTTPRAIEAAWPALKDSFTKRREVHNNERLLAERKKQKAWAEKSKRGGVKSGAARRKARKQIGTMVEPSYEPKGNTPSPSPSPSPNSPHPPTFADCWDAYPRRAGGNSRLAAEKAWKARRREGTPADDLFAGTQRYAAFCAATGRNGTEYVKMASTFFGPGQHWAEPWELPADEWSDKALREQALDREAIV